MISQAPSRFENFDTKATIELQAMEVIWLYVSLQIGNILRNLATFDTFPNLLIIAIQDFDHKGFQESVHI